VTDLIDVGRVYGHFADGATIVLQGLHRFWPPVAQLCRELSDELTHPVQANAYLTPPVAQGLQVHRDAHDVFALHTSGSKQWVVYEAGTPGTDGSGAAPSLDTELQAGDCLYLPKGVAHAARTVDRPSLHLTLGVRTTTWADVLASVVSTALADPSLSDPLPAGYARNPQALADEAGRRLDGVVTRLRAADAGEAVEGAAQRFEAGRAPALTGQLQQLLALGELSDDTVVRRRPDAVASVSASGGMLRVVLGDRTLQMPTRVEPAVRLALRGQPFAVRELDEILDAPGRLTLVRRLVREGLLVVDG